MKSTRLSRFCSIFLSFALLISPLPLAAMVEDFSFSLGSESFELSDNKNLYVCLDKRITDIAQVVSEISSLENDETSPIALLKKYLDDGFIVGLRDEVLFVLEYADSLLRSQQGDYSEELLRKLTAVTEDILSGVLNMREYGSHSGLRLRLLKTNKLFIDNDLM